MKSNVGGIDRILRIVIGLVLIGLTLTGTIGVWGWVGVLPLATGQQLTTLAHGAVEALRVLPGQFGDTGEFGDFEHA